MENGTPSHNGNCVFGRSTKERHCKLRMIGGMKDMFFSFCLSIGGMREMFFSFLPFYRRDVRDFLHFSIGISFGWLIGRSIGPTIKIGFHSSNQRLWVTDGRNEQKLSEEMIQTVYTEDSVGLGERVQCPRKTGKDDTLLWEIFCLGPFEKRKIVAAPENAPLRLAASIFLAASQSWTYRLKLTRLRAWLPRRDN